MTTSLEYEIRIAGAIPESVLIEIEGAHVVVEPVQTVLRGPVADQAALHGIINRLQRLGLDLIEVRRIRPASTADPQSATGTFSGTTSPTEEL